ncbi:MAG: 16S rRNA (guanine(527)-N(7))-methyltransferase RsmG [Puniceicoccales bacterium]|jgi:16S rRNA (guanine527-N7)-methyltransferase|nr:16S rRNA (guanine(527)-N(7))-methyltransferase RsmG [Puniceicoccales bacterium]
MTNELADDIWAKPFAGPVTQWREPLEEYARLLIEKNQVLNLVSRRQEDQILAGHIFPCLAIGILLPFADGSEILDVGTGGGLPGIPLAIMFPKCHFTLLDSIGKKIRAVSEFAEKLNLRNVTTCQSRVENLPSRKKFDVITGRAVAALPQFLQWTWPRVRKPSNLLPADPAMPPSPHGVIYLGGGTIENDWHTLRLPQPQIFSLATHCHTLYVEGKWVMYFPKT